MLDQLAQGETPGDQVQEIGYPVFKVRIQHRDASKGKSGGYRVIYYVRSGDLFILITIYAKTNQVDISPDEIRRMIENYLKSN